MATAFQPQPMIVPSNKDTGSCVEEWNSSCAHDALLCKGTDSQLPDMYAPITDMDDIFSEEEPKISLKKATRFEMTRHSSLMDFVSSFLALPAADGNCPPVEAEKQAPSEVLSEVLDDLDDFSKDPLFPVFSLQACMPNNATSSSPSMHQATGSAPQTSSIKRAALTQDHSNSPQAKRRRTNEVSDSEESSEESGVKFRFYQAAKWQNKLEELIEYKKLHGHCRVPHGYKPNPMLARWAKRQRYQYKLFRERKPSTMTEERVTVLENLGFVWDSHSALWDERYAELKHFCQVMGHANVPSTFPPNPKLAIWVKCQRRQYKLLTTRQPSNMTFPRVQLLNQLQFVWEVRRGSP